MPGPARQTGIQGCAAVSEDETSSLCFNSLGWTHAAFTALSSEQMLTVCFFPSSRGGKANIEAVVRSIVLRCGSLSSRICKSGRSRIRGLLKRLLSLTARMVPL